MAIPKKIIDLVTLALDDRKLTFKEQETIIAEAVNMGIPESEVRAYISATFNERLKTYSKEELTNCPSCGALVPLIDDQCLNCGKSLNSGGTRRVVPVNVKGRAADIIRSENEQTAVQKHNRCQCGAPLPLVSNICEYCGAVLHEQEDSSVNIKKLINSMQASSMRMKNTLRPSFGLVLKYRSSMLCLYFASAFLILSELLDNDTMLCISAVLLPLAFLLVSVTNQGERSSTFPDFNFSVGWLSEVAVYYMFGVHFTQSPIDKADEEYYKALYTYEQYKRQIATIYGKDAGAQKMLNDYSTEIDGYKKVRSRSRNLLLMLFVVLLAIPVAIYLYMPSASEQYLTNRAEHAKIYEMTDFEKTIPCKPYEKNTDGLITIGGDVDLRFDVLDEFHVIPESHDVLYRMRVSGVDLVSTGKIAAQPDSCIFEGALIGKDDQIVGREFFPFRILIRHSNDNYHKIMDKGKGHVWVEMQAAKSTYSAKRLKEVADSASYFLIY